MDVKFSFFDMEMDIQRGKGRNGWEKKIKTVWKKKKKKRIDR